MTAIKRSDTRRRLQCGPGPYPLLTCGHSVNATQLLRGNGRLGNWRINTMPPSTLIEKGKTFVGHTDHIIGRRRLSLPDGWFHHIQVDDGATWI